VSGISTTGFTGTVGSTALGTAGAYKFNYVVKP
jgi:hypothetical protein